MFNATIQLLGFDVALTNLPDTEEEFKALFGADSTPVEDQTRSIVWRGYAGDWRKSFTAKLAEASGVVRPNREGSDKPVTDEVYYNLVKESLTEDQIKEIAASCNIGFAEWANLPTVRSAGGGTGRLAKQFVELGDKAFARIQAGETTIEKFVAMIQVHVPDFTIGDGYDAKDLAKAFKRKADAILAAQSEF